MSTEPRVLTGDLAQIYVPRLVRYLSEAEKTGVLVLSDGDRQVQVYLRAGEVVFVSSGFMPGLSLADFLLARKILGEDVLRESTAAAQRAGKRLGVILVEAGRITPQELYETLGLQIKAKLFRAFTWVRGTYAFREGEIAEAANPLLPINLPNILYEGIRDYVPMDKLPREFRGRKEEPLFRRTPAKIELGDLRMKGREIQMIKLVDGKRSLRDVVAQCGAEDKKEAYKALYGLFILGFVGFAEHATTRVPKAAARKAADDAERVSPGYALRADDLIREAMDSVDRIRRESAQRVPPDVEIETPTLDEPEDLLEPLDLDGAADSPGGTPAPAAPAVDFGYAEDFGLATEETPAPAKAIARPRPEDRRSPVEDETQALELEQPLDLEAARPRPDAPVEAEGPAMFGADHFRGTIAEAHDRDSLPMDPDEAVQRAEFFLDKLDYADALPLLRFAHAKKPGDPGIAPLLGWAIFHAGEGSREAFREAETLLREVTKTDPKNWRAFLALGRIYKATKQRDFAELHLVRALELNKDCAEAKEEIKNLYR